MKKLLTIAIMVIMLLTTLGGTISAAGMEYIFEPLVINETLEPNSTIMAEQTIWYYSVINGVPMKRLWSITYGKWLTNWIPVE
jgi:hypothetical protein